MNIKPKIRIVFKHDYKGTPNYYLLVVTGLIMINKKPVRFDAGHEKWVYYTGSAGVYLLQ